MLDRVTSLMSATAYY